MSATLLARRLAAAGLPFMPMGTSPCRPINQPLLVYLPPANDSPTPGTPTAETVAPPAAPARRPLQLVPPGASPA